MVREHVGKPRSAGYRPARTGWQLASLVAVALLLAACSASPPAPSSAASPPPTTGAQPTAAQGSATSVGTGTAANAATGSDQAWNDLVAAAKQEGTVVFDGPATPAVRDGLPQAFKAEFGIDMQYNGLDPATFSSRLTSERAAGVYSTDVVLEGSDTMYRVVAGGGTVTNGVMGMLAPLQPALVLPAALDTSKYWAGKLWFEDPQGAYVLRISNFVNADLAINTSVIPASAITSYHDLLKPEYTGKIVAYDPTVNGSGLSDAAFFSATFGSDFVAQLYQKQAFLTRDNDQAGNMLGNGSYPIGLSMEQQEVQRLVSQGLPIQYLTNLSDASGYISGGYGLLGLVDHAPHPNAAKLLVNWLAGPEGCKLYQQLNQQLCARNDVGTDPIPDVAVPQQGGQYFDTYDWTFVTQTRATEEATLQQLLGRQ